MSRQQGCYPGYIYLMECAGVFKIGFSSNPKQRLPVVRREHFWYLKRIGRTPDLLRIVHTIKTDNMRSSEAALHDCYRAKRLITHIPQVGFDGYIQYRYVRPEQLMTAGQSPRLDRPAKPLCSEWFLLSEQDVKAIVALSYLTAQK